MNKPITVKELLKLCQLQVAKGNGDRVIMISDDEEGNGYHYLWYQFQTPEEYEEPMECDGKEFKVEFYHANENVAKKEDTIILG